MPQQRTTVDNQMFNKTLIRDAATMDSYFLKLAKRFKSCCRCLANLFSQCDEQLAKIRVTDLNEFLKRIFLFDYKALVFH